MATRELRVGIPAVDQFPAFEDNGVTKRSGLTSGDFEVMVFREGVVDALVPVIAEIGSTGEYTVTFSPAQTGYWVIEVRVLFSNDIWAGYYAVVAQLTNQAVLNIQTQADKIDSVSTLAPATAVSGSLLDRLCNKDGARTYNKSTDSLEAIRDLLSPG